ncbi:MAG: thioredoxin family protein [Bacteroidaceae bacterium]|nr:thioredoxin family protein [Bacteroidaceae bacterium]
MKRIVSLMFFLVWVALAHAQFVSPVKFTHSIKEVSASEAVITFNATISSGWHLYGTQVVKDGPTPTTINIDNISGAKLDGPLKSTTEPIKHYEEMFGADVYFFEKSATFTQKVALTGGKYEIAGYLEYGACNDQNCTPPSTVDFKYSGEVAEKAKPVAKEKEVAQAPVVPVEDVEAEDVKEIVELTDTATTVISETEIEEESSLWSPVIEKLKAFDDGENAHATDNPLWYIFFLGFVGGLVALVTPCVWPIIPMTVSFFLKKGTTKKSSPEEIAAAKKKGRRDAFIYGASIVVIYVTLGLAVTGLFGASALNSLATNAVFNIIFFLMLLLFGASFIGGFELTLPASWTSAVDSKANSTTGLLSIFLMAFTLVLVSFSCTGPIIGFLLVEMVTSTSLVGPTVGMLGFSVALALPFTFFALFPTMLKSAPKSGGWMNVVKVTLGFVELAFSLKFFSVADLAYGWGLLDRETFLSLWIVLFALLGAYLIGWVRFPHDEDEYDDNGNVIVNHKTSVPRFFMALITFAFAIYMIPGLWGAPLKAVSAFAPPMKTQDFNLVESKEVKPMFMDYEEGMKYAAKYGKPVMIDFTGYGCVNCRKMEAAVFTDDEVADIMTNDYVLIQLYVDDRTPLKEPIEVEANGETRKLRTVGDRWSYLQSSKFGATTLPFYVLLDENGSPLAKSYSYDEDVPKFLTWLRSGL